MLQELLAPSNLEFYSKERVRLGDQKSLRQCILTASGVDTKLAPASIPPTRLER